MYLSSRDRDRAYGYLLEVERLRHERYVEKDSVDRVVIFYLEMGRALTHLILSFSLLPEDLVKLERSVERMHDGAWPVWIWAQRYSDQPLSTLHPWVDEEAGRT